MILLAGSSSQHKNRCVEKFKQSNFEVFVFDNPPPSGLPLWSRMDNSVLGDEVGKIFRKKHFNTVVYFLAFPCEEYRADILNAINLLNAMVKYGVKNFVLSSKINIFRSRKQNVRSFKNHTIEKIIDSYSEAYDIKHIKLRHIISDDSEKDKKKFDARAYANNFFSEENFVDAHLLAVSKLGLKKLGKECTP